MKLLTLKQTADILGKSKQWVWVLIVSNKLKAEKVGNQYVIEEQELLNFQKKETTK